MIEEHELTPENTLESSLDSAPDSSLDSTDVLTNQTQFASEEPLYQKVATFMEEKDPEEEAKKHRSRRRLYFIAGGFIAFFVISLTLFVIFAPKRMAAPSTPVSQQQSSTSLPSDELQQHLLSAQQDFKDADPTRNDLPFPPVNGNISLEGQN